MGDLDPLGVNYLGDPGGAGFSLSVLDTDGR